MKLYETPEMEIILFGVKTVITASGDEPTTSWGGGDDGLSGEGEDGF